MIIVSVCIILGFVICGLGISLRNYGTALIGAIIVALGIIFWVIANTLQ